jgi:hypothetical protein
MSLTKKQIEEYRHRLKDNTYIEKANNGIAENFLTGAAVVKLPAIKSRRRRRRSVK